MGWRANKLKVITMMQFNVCPTLVTNDTFVSLEIQYRKFNKDLKKYRGIDSED